MTSLKQIHESRGFRTISASFTIASSPQLYNTIVAPVLYRICENFCWIRFHQALLRTFVVQKMFVEIIFANAVKVAISSMQSLITR